MFIDALCNIDEILKCPDCYRHSNEKFDEFWFTKPCTRNNHELVYAKVDGLPYWPAKVITKDSVKYDVRFFGRKHSRYVLSKRHLKPIRKDTSAMFDDCMKTDGLQNALDELKKYQSLVKQGPERFSFEAETKLRVFKFKARRVRNHGVQETVKVPPGVDTSNDSNKFKTPPQDDIFKNPAIPVPKIDPTILKLKRKSSTEVYDKIENKKMRIELQEIENIPLKKNNSEPKFKLPSKQITVPIPSTSKVTKKREELSTLEKVQMVNKQLKEQDQQKETKLSRKLRHIQACLSIFDDVENVKKATIKLFMFEASKNKEKVQKQLMELERNCKTKHWCPNCLTEVNGLVNSYCSQDCRTAHFAKLENKDFIEK